MFYLETKDGEKFFTKDSDDDQAVFKRIIEDKLGKDALILFKQLFEYGEKEREEVLEQIEYYEYRLSEIWDVVFDEENYSDLDKINLIGDIVCDTI